MARVEAPTTFMTAYQQGRQNRRQDKLDNQNLAFSVFDEKRNRDKHEAFIDRAEEDTRHAKTMNPLMESLRLYENELKWNTLDSSISRHKEETRHQKADHRLTEAKKTMEGDAYATEKLLRPDDYNYSSGMDAEEQDMIGKTRDVVDKMKYEGVNLGRTELDTKAKYAEVENKLGEYILNEHGALTDQERGEWGYEAFQNKYLYPTKNLNQQYGLGFTENQITGKTQDYQFKVLDGMETNLTMQAGFNKLYKDKLEAWQKMPKGKKRDTAEQELMAIKRLIGPTGLANMAGGK